MCFIIIIIYVCVHHNAYWKSGLPDFIGPLFMNINLKGLYSLKLLAIYTGNKI